MILESKTYQRRASTAKRRPNSTSNIRAWFTSKDTVSAILSSQTLANEFTNLPKENSSIIRKCNTKVSWKEKVPKFTALPDKYQRVCQTRSVNERTEFTTLFKKGAMKA